MTGWGMLDWLLALWGGVGGAGAGASGSAPRGEHTVSMELSSFSFIANTHRDLCTVSLLGHSITFHSNSFSPHRVLFFRLAIGRFALSALIFFAASVTEFGLTPICSSIFRLFQSASISFSWKRPTGTAQHVCMYAHAAGPFWK